MLDFSLWNFIVKVHNNYLNPQLDICYYEVIPCHQTTYCDLDLKFSNIKFVEKELLVTPFLMAQACVDLLAIGYDKYLSKKLDKSKVIIGDGCRESKISFHITYYDGENC